MVFTNAVGAVFTAALLSAGEGGVTVVFPEDGATNTLPYASLSPASARAACDAVGYVRVPPLAVPAYGMLKRDLERIDALLADGRISIELARTRRLRAYAAFERACRAKGVLEADIDRLKHK